MPDAQAHEAMTTETGGRDQSGSQLATAEVYDPALGTFGATVAMNAIRQNHTATRLNDGRVLITGGLVNNFQNLSSAELYDPVTNSFTPTGNMTTERQEHTATLLPSGKVLIVAGALASRDYQVRA